MTIPLYCIGVAFFLIYLPRLLVIRAQLRRPEGLDNINPREQQKLLDPAGLRANAAHQNAFESFAPFAAAVILSHIAHANPRLSAAAALTHVASRTIYPFVYVAGFGALRTAVWALGFLATAALFVLAYSA